MVQDLNQDFDLYVMWLPLLLLLLFIQNKEIAAIFASLLFL